MAPFEMPDQVGSALREAFAPILYMRRYAAARKRLAVAANRAPMPGRPTCVARLTPSTAAMAVKHGLASKRPCFPEVVAESIAGRLLPVFCWLKRVEADPEAIGAPVDL